MIFSTAAILFGLFWNHQNISVRKETWLAKWLANANTVVIYTFSLLAWLMIAISLAEFSLGIIIFSFVIGMLTFNGSQRKQDYKSNPFFFGFISVLVPIVTLPSAQANKQKYESSDRLKAKNSKGSLSSMLLANKRESLNEECNGLSFEKLDFNSTGESSHLEMNGQTSSSEKQEEQALLHSTSITTKDSLDVKEAPSPDSSSHKNGSAGVKLSLQTTLKANQNSRTTSTPQKWQKEMENQRGKK